MLENMLTMGEIAKRFHVHVNTVAMWRQEGLIQGIKTGKNYMFSEGTVAKFQREFEGMDISNRKKAIMALKAICQRKVESQYAY